MAEKVAILFSGQGAQYVGMGRDLYEKSASAKSIIDSFESQIPGMKQICFEGSQDSLNLTINAQPCLMSVGLATAYALQDAGVVFSAAAGFSLGESAALVYSGVMSLEEGIRTVRHRAELMHACALNTQGAMAAVMGLSDDEVIAWSRDSGTYAVNFNCPGQVVVAGAEEKIDLMIASAKQHGARAIKLKVSGAFHSPYMDKASEGMKEFLKKLELKKPSIPLYSNYTGCAITSDDNLQELISNQINNPVRWTAIINNLIEEGYMDFVEVGAGKTLSGLVKKICPTARVISADGNGFGEAVDKYAKGRGQN